MNTKQVSSYLCMSLSLLILCPTAGLANELPSAATNMRTVNSFFANAAAKQGYMSMNAMGVAPRAQQSAAPTRQEAVAAIRALPAIQHFSELTHTPDPTEHELIIMQGGDVPNGVLGLDLIAADAYMGGDGTITGADQSLTGYFDDLTTMTEPTDAELDPALDAALDTGTFADETIDVALSDIISANIAPDSGTTSLTMQMDPLSNQTVINADGLITFESADNTFQNLSASNAPSLESIAMALLAPTRLCADELPLAEKVAAAREQASAQPIQLVALLDVNACAVIDMRQDSMLRGFVERTDVPEGNALITLTSKDAAWHNNEQGQSALDSGAAVVRADRDTVVELPCGTLKLNKGALAFIEVTRDTVKIRACSGPGHTSLRTADQTINVNIGEEAIITTEKCNVSLAMALRDGIAKRAIHQHSLADGKQIYISDFSIVSMLSADPALADIKAANEEGLQATREQLLKAAAVVQVARKGQGRFYSTSARKLPARAFAG